jgi:DNA-binding response OmpR family regulator
MGHSQDAMKSPSADPPTTEQATPAGQSILLIDDDAGSIRLLSEMLRGEGYRLFAALNGQEGFQRALQHVPALVLLDLHMPGLDGQATCRLFKATPRLAGVPIIFLTGSGLLDDKLHAFAEGAVDYIVKPFSAAEVVARLRVHLRLAAARGEVRPAPAAEPPRGAPPWQAADERMVARAKALLLQDLGAAVTLAELAHALGSNERSLTDAFRRHTGMAVFEFLRQERFRAACERLLHSRMPIGQIGEAMGFRSPAAFTFAFRSHCGMSPGGYRQTAGLGPVEPGDGA